MPWRVRETIFGSSSGQDVKVPLPTNCYGRIWWGLSARGSLRHAKAREVMMMKIISVLTRTGRHIVPAIVTTRCL